MGVQVDLYGIRNCDTVKKARAWLDAQGIAHVFHDYKVEGADPRLLATWCERLGWETVLNRSGTTFRGLPEADKGGLDAPKAIGLMAGNPSMIKRPMLVRGADVMAGFRPEAYARFFGS